MPFPKSFDVSRFSGTIGGRPGPKTPQGKAIAARNATSHGLFARDIVLPSLGEDPGGYDALYFALCDQVNPRNLMENHYVEVISAASWRLRRLHRWQAQVYENEALTEDERIDKLDRVLRHETALHRQIDKAIRLLGRDVPFLFEGRARKEALATLGQTERSCRKDPAADQNVADETQDNLQFNPVSVDRKRLDNVPISPEAANDPEALETVDEAPKTQICQNELPAEAESEAENQANAAEEDAAEEEALVTVKRRSAADLLPKKKGEGTSFQLLPRRGGEGPEKEKTTGTQSAGLLLNESVSDTQ